MRTSLAEVAEGLLITVPSAEFFYGSLLGSWMGLVVVATRANAPARRLAHGGLAISCTMVLVAMAFGSSAPPSLGLRHVWAAGAFILGALCGAWSTAGNRRPRAGWRLPASAIAIATVGLAAASTTASLAHFARLVEGRGLAEVGRLILVQSPVQWALRAACLAQVTVVLARTRGVARASAAVCILPLAVVEHFYATRMLVGGLYLSASVSQLVAMSGSRPDADDGGGVLRQRP